MSKPTTNSPSDVSVVKLNITDGLAGLHCGPGALTGGLGLFVQAVLAFIAFTTLIAKRFCEPKYERRPWLIWFFDTSKQGFGATVIHFSNVFLADMFQGDPCTWYVVSFLLDSTIGLLVIYIGLKIATYIVTKKGCESLKFGEYGSPPQCSAWIGQCGLYILVMLVEKILMTLLVQFSFWKKFRKFIMSPIKNPKLELVIVMFIVPLIVNAIIFWVIDNFLMKKVKQRLSKSNKNDASSKVKYYKAADKVKCYDKTDKVEDSDSDVLLSVDEDNHASVDSRSSDRYQLLQNLAIS